MPDKMMARLRGLFWIGLKFNYTQKVFELMDILNQVNIVIHFLE